MDLDLRGAFKTLSPAFALSHLRASQQFEHSDPASHAAYRLVLFCTHPCPNLRQSLTDINSEVVQAELRTATAASKTAQAFMVKAAFDAFISSLELDQVTFRATDARAKTAEETSNHKAADLLEAVHHRSWDAAEAFANSRFPVFYGKADTLSSELPSQMACWLAKTTIGNQGVARIVWVNLSVLGVVSAGKLAWVADHVAAELHSSPGTSVAIIIQGNRSYDEQRNKVEDADMPPADEADAKCEPSSSESGDEDQLAAAAVPWDGNLPGQGSARMGHAKSLRAFRSKIEEVFSEMGRGLTVDNAQIVFDPTTVWGSRQGYHNMLVVMPRSVPPSLPSPERWRSAPATLDPLHGVPTSTSAVRRHRVLQPCHNAPK
jgi:hypothetical protein